MHFFGEVLVVAFSLQSHMKLLAIPTRIMLNENGPLYCSQVPLVQLIQGQPDPTHFKEVAFALNEPFSCSVQ